MTAPWLVRPVIFAREKASGVTIHSTERNRTLRRRHSRESSAAQAFRFGRLLWFGAATDGAAFHFLPIEPDVARDAAGRAQSTLVDIGTSAYLLLSGRWLARESELAALTQEIAATRAVRPDDIRLSFAPIQRPRCNLLLGDGDGSFEPIATSATSGVPPYDAVFSVPLDEDKGAKVKAALRGDRGLLAIEYLAELPVPVQGTATLRSTAGELVPWLRSHAGEGTAVELLEEAVGLGLAAVVVEAPEAHHADLAVQLYERVLARAAEVLPRWLAAWETADIHVEVSLEQSVGELVRAFADIGALVSNEAQGDVTGGQDAAN